MTGRNIAAFTASSYAGNYPPYVSINEVDGEIEISVRSAGSGLADGTYAKISLTPDEFDALVEPVIAHSPVKTSRASAAAALLLAAGKLGGMKRAAAHANVVGYHSEAYGAAEVELQRLAEMVKRGDEVRDHNGLVHRFGGAVAI
ncbi:MAG: hypothetical protein E5V72_01990 [Mesorhizobium sp.]|uniref:hypothetical protein n=1 Tax=Mesorhizobium sp. TaxID=1871066 RepID=UPI000FE8DE1C|nr:hypothetical protein [Mesorhizobium sp.]RWH52195.1 MAG: hypothetical protein EOQ82_27325 [Mesorhizobium sp.]RWI63437.1 MAG: hypothetical protein EOR18_31580 [Mesorhizobium sp.]RWI74828.1 MAG: hypothetical protein EOR19_20300 [Mesorhizobium sp.]RWJ33321.1 MAG: hypothetical protein EOR28_12095 [Mesorhizobium sp.]TIQ65176.1 MAG: hypothetical protein E5X41_13370 [Mesorhizobium sp.]